VNRLSTCPCWLLLVIVPLVTITQAPTELNIKLHNKYQYLPKRLLNQLPFWICNAVPSLITLFSMVPGHLVAVTAPVINNSSSHSIKRSGASPELAWYTNLHSASSYSGSFFIVMTSRVPTDFSLLKCRLHGNDFFSGGTRCYSSFCPFWRQLTSHCVHTMRRVLDTAHIQIPVDAHQCF